MSTQLTVSPSVLQWARKSAGLSIPQVASALNVKTDFVLELESRPRAIGKTTLRRLAQIYDRPLAVLFLPSPPDEHPIPTDYRTIPTARQHIGSDTARALREAKRLQEALSDLKEDNPALFPTFPSLEATVTERPGSVASRIRRSLKVTEAEQKQWPDTPHAFRHWRGKLQNLGIIVILQYFPREEARGFSLWHPDLVPMIVVNRNEAPAAQIFTLLHELAHILLRSDAMCLKQESSTLLGTVEAWCNKVAAAVLVPDDDLRTLLAVGGQATAKEWQPEDLHRLASRLKVSRHVIAIKLEALGLAPSGYYARIRGLIESDDYAVPRVTRRADSKSTIRRNMPVERLAEVGFVATNAVLQACKSASISTMEAADLLRVHPRDFGRLVHLASAQSERYG